METVKLCINCNKNNAAKGRRKCWTCTDKQRSPEAIEKRRKQTSIRTNKWQKANRKAVNEWRRGHRKTVKEEVLNKYGGICACCKESNIGFLTIDHINQDGHIRKKQNVSEVNIFEYLNNKEVNLSIYQVLCFNCNCGRYINGGICPHNEGENESEISETLSLSVNKLLQ
jgi:hypothetical protein